MRFWNTLMNAVTGAAKQTVQQEVETKIAPIVARVVTSAELPGVDQVAAEMAAPGPLGGPKWDSLPPAEREMYRRQVLDVFGAVDRLARRAL